MHSLRNGIEKLYQNSFFYLFLKLIHTIFIFSDNVGSKSYDITCVNKIANIDYGYLYLWDIDLLFNKFYYLGTISDPCVTYFTI